MKSVHSFIVEIIDDVFKTGFDCIVAMLFCLLGMVCSGVSNITYLIYKRLLLWSHTYNLRNGHPPYLFGFTAYSKWKDWLLCLLKGKKRNIPEVKRQPKGLVGVIAVNIKQVLNANISNQSNSLNEIYFADKDGDYYNRNTKLTEEAIEQQCKIISDYYKDLQNTIANNFPDNPLFEYEELNGNKIVKTPICKKMLDLYSTGNICKYIEKVNDEMNSNNAIHFIGDKIGIKDFVLENENLQLVIYKTDHFTWQVFKEIFKANKPFFQELILRLNSANFNEQRMLVQSLAFLFSSVGIDIIIESKNCQGQRNLLITARSGKIEKDKKTSLHVSVNETFSRTDNVGASEQNYDLNLCVKRGIQEELGIPEEDISDSLIKFQDFAVVTDEGEIGLSCYVDLSEKMPTEQILMYPGQDKFLENEEILILPYLNVNHLALVKSVNSSRFMRQFYLSTYNDCFCMPWMSFTPLLISRVMLRNLQKSKKYELFSNLACWIGFGVVLSLFFSPPINSHYMKEQLIGFFGGICGPWLWNYLKEWVIKLLAGVSSAAKNYINGKNHKYEFIQPLVSQWHGNVKVIQATGFNNDVSKDLTINIANDTFTNTPVKLSDLELEHPPRCSVRIKKNKNTYSEKPVSFYTLRKGGDGGHSCGHLRFLMLNVRSHGGKTELYIRLHFEKDTFSGNRKIKKISFAKELDIFIDKFGNNGHVDSGYIKTHLPEQIIEQYELLDLFSFKDDFYWSCYSKKTMDDFVQDTFELKDKECMATEIDNFYQEIMRIISSVEEDEGSILISINGSNSLMEPWLNNFVSHRENKRRIAELELYMLQFYFIRQRIVFADCKYVNKMEYRIYRKK